ncbi:conserved exported protein of unknown function [Rhodovastum atsumiense]|uniref:Peptidase A2 domain-containing protein n=1 Tax=Rhodovastum atsumiense TaxID=504468 RepID=A0A5M6IZI6_9PROT|nr:aspartyl protease family protein [Rhodovastum atsumiense]KAA5613713.1 hypothetical protein F1189_04710 [Rhodovastum atsumiense]CAH2599636.1 conserved exported protein of unknown function [Rhodovastum atsumiense]
MIAIPGLPCRSARPLAIGLVALGLSAAPAAGGSPLARDTACRAETRAELPVTVQRNFLLVPAALDGGRTLMLVDTGAEASTVTPEAARTLGLAWQRTGRTIVGVGGTVQGGSVRVRHMDLGPLRHVALTLDVGSLPSLGGRGRPVAGLLGADVLDAYDIEIDVPGQAMRLHAVSPCPGFIPPGYRSGNGHPLSRTRSGLLFLSVEVEGRRMRALLDTGARGSLITPRAASQAGVTEAALARDPVVTGRGLGGARLAFRQHRFNEVRVGASVARDMVMSIAPLPLEGVDMLLGADWLAGRRIWISRAANRLFQERGDTPR